MTAMLHRLLTLTLAFAIAPAASQPRWEGQTTPVVLAPFDRTRPGCPAPKHLARSLVFAQDNDRQFMQGVAAGLAAAARDRGLEFRVAMASNNPTLMIEHIEVARAANTGALVAAPINPGTLAPSLKSMIEDGAYVGTIVPPPAVSLLNAPQFLTGQVLADAAVEYITASLGGKARVVLLTHDTNQYLAQRFAAMRQSFKKVPGATIVADISPNTVNRQGGYDMMKKILIAHPNVDVVLGADTVVLGALAAVREAGRNRPDQFFGGIDGEPEAVAELKKGGEYKASVSLASPVFAYAMGQHAADWLEGRSIPQAMDILPTRLTLSNIARYEDDLADPGAVYRDEVRQAEYLKMYGNICHDTRHQFLNFPWSSERR